jgi:hypothetical protein
LGQFEVAWDGLGRFGTVWDIGGTVCVIGGQFGTVWDIGGLFVSLGDSLGQFGTVWDCLGHFFDIQDFGIESVPTLYIDLGNGV